MSTLQRVVISYHRTLKEYPLVFSHICTPLISKLAHCLLRQVLVDGVARSGRVGDEIIIQFILIILHLYPEWCKVPVYIFIGDSSVGCYRVISNEERIFLNIVDWICPILILCERSFDCCIIFRCYEARVDLGRKPPGEDDERDN